MPAVLELIPVVDVAQGFRDPSRPVFDAPHTTIKGRRFEFNSTHFILLSAMAEDATLPFIKTFGHPPKDNYRCDSCGWKFQEDPDAFDPARLVKVSAQVRLNHDNLKGMFTPAGVVTVIFKGTARCNNPECSHIAPFMEELYVPSNLILGVIHASEAQ